MRRCSMKRHQHTSTHIHVAQTTLAWAIESEWQRLSGVLGELYVCAHMCERVWLKIECFADVVHTFFCATTRIIQFLSHSLAMPRPMCRAVATHTHKPKHKRAHTHTRARAYTHIHTLLTLLRHARHIHNIFLSACLCRIEGRS